MKSDMAQVIQLLTANLAYRTAPGDDPKATPEHDVYMTMVREIGGSPRSGGVFMELTQFAGTAIMRLAAERGEDPIELWRAFALEYAQHADEGDGGPRPDADRDRT